MSAATLDFVLTALSVAISAGAGRPAFAKNSEQSCSGSRSHGSLFQAHTSIVRAEHELGEGVVGNSSTRWLWRTRGKFSLWAVGVVIMILTIAFFVFLCFRFLAAGEIAVVKRRLGFHSSENDCDVSCVLHDDEQMTFKLLLYYVKSPAAAASSSANLF